jgi:proteasome accessory factor C
MANNMTTTDRVMLLMSLVAYLQDTGPTSISDLSATFGVEAPLLRRLVRFLGVAGVPGETRTYQHEDLFDIDWEALEQHDVVHLTHTVALDDTPRFSSSETAALIAGLHAVQSLLPAPMQDVAKSAATKLASVESPQPGPMQVSVRIENDDPQLARLTVALHERKRVRFEYRSFSGSLTHRTVDPIILTQRGNAWYLRAHCLTRNDERTFLLDAIRSLEVLDQPTRTQSEPVIEQSFSPSLTTLTATLRIRPHAVHRISDFLPRMFETTQRDWWRAEVDLAHPEAAVRLVQSAPGEVILESPFVAVEAVRVWAERGLARYDA